MTKIIHGDFHEGMNELEISNNGVISESGARARTIEFKSEVTNSEEFILATLSGMIIKFSLVENDDEIRFISKTLPYGEYLDSLNRKYVFADSVFSTPFGEKYRNGVQIDCNGGPPACDCIYLDTIPYHFSFSSDTLKIYELYGDEYMKTRDDPKWVLRKNSTL